MIRSREVIPSPLQHAMLATRVLMALDLYQDPDYGQRLENAMANALQYFDKILEGRKNTKDLRISEGSYESALAYGEAIRAIEISPARGDESTEFLAFVNNLKRAAEELKNNKRADQQSVESLKNFFKDVRSVAMNFEERPLEKVSLLA